MIYSFFHKVAKNKRDFLLRVFFSLYKKCHTLPQNLTIKPYDDFLVVGWGLKLLVIHIYNPFFYLIEIIELWLINFSKNPKIFLSDFLHLLLNIYSGKNVHFSLKFQKFKVRFFGFSQLFRQIGNIKNNISTFDFDWHGPPPAGWIVDPGRCSHGHGYIQKQKFVNSLIVLRARYTHCEFALTCNWKLKNLSG